MLVISRKRREWFMVGEAKIEIVEVRDGRVRLGITAPPHVKVLREEVIRAIENGEKPVPPKGKSGAK